MMNDLKLPERLSGPWDHALIMTYGADIPFFENALWGQFGASCRNKIILADGQRHLEACENYARSRLLRHMNQRYVVEGVFGLRAAHGKVILLTNTKAGRLLIGSGNLSLQGYASGGEQFSEYEYTAEAPEQLPAFLAVRELIEALVTRGCITGAQACRRIAHLFENTTWLFSARLEDWRPVRDNLALSFLDQLREAVGTRPVEELWTLSPFYDRDTVALQRLMETLQPRQLHLLVQPRRTSIDATRLKGVLGQYPHRCQIHTFRKGENNPYVHAKMYLLKLEESALCLQGSPNLSQAAMLMIPPFGNLEIANLLSGRRDEFDHLLAALNIDSPVVDLDGLGLSYQSPEHATPLAPQALQLTSGEWHRDHLRLHVRGSLPETNEFELMIGTRAFRLNVLERYRGELDMQLPPEAAAFLAHPVPANLRWFENGSTVVSNAIFICNREALDQELAQRNDSETLPKVGNLELDDEEIELLLGELDASLLVDHRSIWQVAGRSPLPASEEDESGPVIRYEDVDIEALRHHPRVQQYIAARTGVGGYRRTRLQIILNAIVDHFRGLLDAPAGMATTPTPQPHSEGEEGESEEEREQRDRERQRQRQSAAQRTNRLLKSFIRRYLRGIRSLDFQRVAGFDVMTQNYFIFSHLLWRLLARDWVEPEFLVESLLTTWGIFWGDQSQKGYFRSLPDEHRDQLSKWSLDYHPDAELLAALYCGAVLTRPSQHESIRFKLRDFWRTLTLQMPFELTPATMEVVWKLVGSLMPYAPPLPSAIVTELAHLTRFDTRPTSCALWKRNTVAPNAAAVSTRLACVELLIAMLSQ